MCDDVRCDDETRNRASFSHSTADSQHLSTSVDISELEKYDSVFYIFSYFFRFLIPRMEQKSAWAATVGRAMPLPPGSWAVEMREDAVAFKASALQRFASLSGGAAGSKGAVQNAEDPRPSC